MLLLSPAEQQEHSLTFPNVLCPFDWAAILGEGCNN